MVGRPKRPVITAEQYDGLVRDLESASAALECAWLLMVAKRPFNERDCLKALRAATYVKRVQNAVVIRANSTPTARTKTQRSRTMRRQGEKYTE